MTYDPTLYDHTDWLLVATTTQSAKVTFVTQVLHIIATQHLTSKPENIVSDLPIMYIEI